MGSWNFLNFGKQLKKLGLAGDLGDVLKGKPALDPILSGIIDPIGRWTPSSLDELDKFGLRGLGETTNHYGPAIAGLIFGGLAVGGGMTGGALGGAEVGAGGAMDMGVGLTEMYGSTSASSPAWMNFVNNMPSFPMQSRSYEKDYATTDMDPFMYDSPYDDAAIQRSLEEQRRLRRRVQLDQMARSAVAQI